MDWNNPEDVLAFDIKFALQQHKYRPPPRFDNDLNAADRYYSFVASAIRDQLKLSWTFTRKSDGEKEG